MTCYSSIRPIAQFLVVVLTHDLILFYISPLCNVMQSSRCKVNSKHGMTGEEWRREIHIISVDREIVGLW